MDRSPQPLNAPVFCWEAEKPNPNRFDLWLKRAEAVRTSQVQRIRKAVEAYVSASRDVIHKINHKINRSARLETLVPPKALAAWGAAQPVLVVQTRKLLPFLPSAETPTAAEEPDPVEVILADFAGLDREKQEKVAENVALLWDYFQEMFGGVSGFLAAPATERSAYMEKLKKASERMEAARGTEVAFHYVTVELVRQYLSFLQSGLADPKAILLATRVVSLIERGRRMPPVTLAHASDNPQQIRTRVA